MSRTTVTRLFIGSGIAVIAGAILAVGALLNLAFVGMIAYLVAGPDGTTDVAPRPTSAPAAA